MSIHVETLTVHRSDREVLSDVSLQFDPEEVVALVGPNGAGKSTLLAAISGGLEPSTGRAWLNGINVTELTAPRLAELRVVMRQSFSLPFAFSVSEVVEMGLLRHRDRSAMGRALEWADLLHLSDRPVTQLSGGERQRVSLARALAQLFSSPEEVEARYLLLDEPTASLDLKHQRLVMDVCRDVARAGCGVITVLHDLNLAAAYADRIAVLRDGHLSGIGAPDQVLTEDHIGTVYGTPVTVSNHARKPVVHLEVR